MNLRARTTPKARHDALTRAPLWLALGFLLAPRGKAGNGDETKLRGRGGLQHFAADPWQRR